jgi:aspartate carbamoyltransferase catalytic subunit
MAPMAARTSLLTTRHIVSINDLTDGEIERIFQTAQSYLERFPDPNFPYRIRRSTNVASDFILASLFYEPSTRTRLSFESAMLRLGGDVITSADPLTSSAAKGESLADSVRVVGNYADVIVIRHPRDGAARLAAEYSPVPIINGGDGSHEHPTQTLCDIFTLRRKKKSLRKLNVAIAGDLKGSRTIHSFVYALARLGAHIVPMPAPGMELPSHVDRRLREEFGCSFRRQGSIGALYMTPDEPHQPALFSDTEFEFQVKRSGEKIAAVYVTRFQKERWADKEQSYPKIDADFLRERKFSQASVLHPLPRVGELDVALDRDARAVYFEQAAYGVPIRMALISLLLGLEGTSFEQYQGGFQEPHWPLYDQPLNVGLRCANPNCIVHEPMEGPYVRNRFHIVALEAGLKLRCLYCENDIDRFVVASRKGKWYSSEAAVLAKLSRQKLKDIVIFENDSDAQRHGYHSRRSAAAA